MYAPGTDGFAERTRFGPDDSTPRPAPFDHAAHAKTDRATGVDS
jgi:hypothetical protein